MTATFAPPVGEVKEFLMRRKCWTRAEYDHLVNIGFFTPNDKLELLEGDLIKKMSMNPPHATGFRRMDKAMNRLFAEGYDVRTQLPLALGDISEPEPDIAVVAGTEDDFSEAHPTTAVLVIEVADSSLYKDRTQKAPIYARAGIPEYVIMNVSRKTLEVYRNPGLLQSRRPGYGYAEKTVLKAGDTWTPLAAPDAVPIAVADLMP